MKSVEKETLNVQNELKTAISQLESLLALTPASIHEKTLENFYKWISAQVELLVAEQKPFSVPADALPKTIKKSSFEFFAKKYSKVKECYCSDNMGCYSRKSGISSEDATSLYRAMYLRPRNIVWIDFGFNVGCEFGGKHPALILKNLGKHALMVAPISTNKENTHSISNTIVTFSPDDCCDMQSKRERFTDITRITPVSVYRVCVGSAVGSLRREKHDEVLSKIRKYYGE